MTVLITTLIINDTPLVENIHSGNNSVITAAVVSLTLYLDYVTVESKQNSFFSFTTSANYLKEFLTYNEYDLEKLVKTEEIVSNSINSIRIAADCMHPIINNMTQTVRTINYTFEGEPNLSTLDDIALHTYYFEFLADYIRGHVMNISQYCLHAKSKIEVMLQTVDYMELTCNNINDVIVSMDRDFMEAITLKKHVTNFIFDMALIEQFLYDSCDKLMTPIRFIDDRNRDLSSHTNRIDEFTNLMINDTIRDDIGMKRLLHDSEDIYLAASQMLNITDKIKNASNYLFAGKEATTNTTINNTLKFGGYKLFQTNFIFVISRSVSAFMQITRQKFIRSNATESHASNKELDHEENYEDKIKIDESVCTLPRINFEINKILENISDDNSKVQNLSTSIGDILIRIKRETPTTKEMSRTLKRDADRINKLLRDIKYRTKYLMLLITTCYPVFNVTRDASECVYYCADEIKPVCGIDGNLGYNIFLNKCMLYAHNKCKGTHYLAFDIEMCLRSRIKEARSFKVLMGQKVY